MVPFLIPAITQSISAIAKIGLGIKQNRMANKIKPVRTDYQVSPYAKNQLGLANQLFNGRMAGASNMEQNILASQGNMMASVGRNATDGSQALSMAAAAQGQTDQSMAGLGMAEAQNKIAMLGNLNQANQGMTMELDKVYQDKLSRYQEDVQAKNALRNAAWQNFGGAMSDASSLGMQAGYQGWFNKKPGQNSGLSQLGINSAIGAITGQ